MIELPRGTILRAIQKDSPIWLFSGSKASLLMIFLTLFIQSGLADGALQNLGKSFSCSELLHCFSGSFILLIIS